MNLRQQILVVAVLPLVLAILAITALVMFQSARLAGANIATFERNMLKAKENELLNLTNMAVSAISDVYSEAGPDDEANKDRVRKILSALNYGPDGYFFVYDYDGVNVVHPRQPYRHGRNWIDLTDPDGNRVIYNLIERAKEGGGLHQYKWQKPSTGAVVDKLSFAVGLDKWRWMLGTGVYLDDVFAQTEAARADLRSSVNMTFAIVAAITLPIVFGVFLGSFMLTLRERRVADVKLKALTQRVIHAQEEERTRLARELHDGISQTMVAARYMLDLAMNKVRCGATDTLQVIERGAAGLNGAIKEVRRISHDLRPRMLDDLGLTPSLEALANSFTERTGIPVELKSAAFRNGLTPDARTALYRVAQEALSNIERHAGATKVRIRLTRQNGIQLAIEDDGHGISGDHDRDRGRTHGGLGLRNMQERMEHFGGSFDIRSGPSGTTLKAKLPRSVFETQRAAELERV